MDPVAQAGDKHKQQAAYAPGAYYVPATAMAPMAAPFAASPVLVGAISTASAPTYYPAPTIPTYGSAPVMVTTGTVATANAPAATTATIANAPTAGTVYYYNPTATAGVAGAPVALAPGNSGLTQDQINSIFEELKELKDSLKDQGTTGSDRKSQLLTKARQLVADEKGSSEDDLKASDRVLARRLVDQAMGVSQTGTPAVYGLAPQGAIQYQYQYALPAQAAAPMQSYYLYPVPMMPVKACGHRHFCLCGRYP
jgi:hypothetical protein